MKTELDILLKKYHQGDCTPAELHVLRQYFLLENLDELHALLAQEWAEVKQSTQPTDQALKADIWKHIQQEAFERSGAKVVDLKKNTRSRRWKRGIAIAASLVGLLIIGMWMWQPTLQQNTLVEKVNVSDKVMQVALADGTTVWLNRNSQIRYERNFNDSIRAVTLVGEAFFEVTKNPGKPFVVHTGQVQTKVLGTSFNVRAFANGETIEVALVEGKVNVEMDVDSTKRHSEILAPGDVFAYRKTDNTFTKEQFENDAPYAWRDGFIHFDRADVQEVAQTLENWYDVTITIEQDSLIQGTLVHKFNATELTLEQALRGISLVSNYQFEPTGNGAYRIVPKQ